jgi:hypothetical protein
MYNADFYLRCAFVRGGYRVTRAEKFPEIHVVVVWATREDARPVLRRSVRDLLHRAGYRLARRELAVSQMAKRVIVTFIDGI